MARPKSNTVDYFPHECDHGRKMHIVEQQFGNDGYAGWMKMLEALGKTEFHYLDLNEETTRLYLQSKMNVSDTLFLPILNILARIGAIDKELWNLNIIWSVKFVASIQDAYKRRSNNCITKEQLEKRLCIQKHSLCIHKPGKCIHKPSEIGVSTHINPQRKEKESKVKESKEKKVPKKIKFREFVFMTEKEKEKLIEKFGEEDTNYLMDEVDNYKGTHGKKYKDDYRACLGWPAEKLKSLKEKNSGQKENRFDKALKQFNNEHPEVQF